MTYSALGSYEMSELGRDKETADHSDAAKQFSRLYNGTIFDFHGDEITIQEAAERVACGVIQRREGRWAITEFGIECLAMYYAIPSHRVHEYDWLEHMSQKTWMTEQDRADLETLLIFGRDRWPKTKP